MELTRRLDAASGYLTLGLDEDAWKEIEDIEIDDLPCDEDRASYLALVLELAVRGSDWSLGAGIADALRLVAPGNAAAFLHGAYCLHELGRTADARELLVHGPEALRGLPVYHYNLGCYNAVLGDREQALACVREAFEMEPALRNSARKDPDLKGLVN